MALSVIENRGFFAPHFLPHFIQEYKNCTALWKVNSKDYMRRNETAKAWSRLVKLCQMQFPSANVHWVKSKVHSLKGSFNKEFKKVIRSLEKGEDVKYQPKLWYYDLFLFTKDGNDTKPSINEVNVDYRRNIKERSPAYDNERIHHGAIAEKQDSYEFSSPSTEKNVVPVSRKRSTYENRDCNAERSSTSLSDATEEETKTSSDEFVLLGHVFANKLRRVANANYNQYILAEKLMNEAIYKALQQELTGDSTINKHNPILKILK